MYKLRDAQQRILEYTRGKMGVSAVPGSGKTYTLSLLAAKLISRGEIDPRQEILVVTMSNSAVNNFSSRIGEFIKEQALVPGIGYRVRTLHGLANDIIRERPDLAGLPEHFQIIDDRDADEMLRTVVQSWVSTHREFLLEWSDPDQNPETSRSILRDWPDLVLDTARAFIRQAKDFQVTPKMIRDLLRDTKTPQPLIEMGLDMYEAYHRGLAYRSAVDFDDLIRLALQALRSDEELLAQLRYRWPYILEDEAQDSSRLQEEILSLLVGENGNWVRMGDPNQAIYESFTTAKPMYLRDFLQRRDVAARELPNSGRSTRNIINMANFLIDWTRENHPAEALRDALSVPKIKPTDPGDPQPNPPENPAGIYLSEKAFKPSRRDEEVDEELDFIVKSVRKWLSSSPQGIVAALVPSNYRGAKLSKKLRENGIPTVELLQSTHTTRQIADLLCAVLQALNNPDDRRLLQTLYRKMKEKVDGPSANQELISAVVDCLGTCKFLEAYLWPTAEVNWLADLNRQSVAIEIVRELEDFSQWLVRWQQASLLPADQLLLTVAQDLFSQPADLALSHKLAVLIERAARSHPDWGPGEFIKELQMVVNNERKMIGFESEDTGFTPEDYPGQVVVATMHKAKGLEWDRVYLLSVNNYDFPSALPSDKYRAERWYIKNKLNLQAETLSRLSALVKKDVPGLYLAYGTATEEDRLQYSAERLRLLYVGITRARKELMLSYNTGRNGDCSAALPFIALLEYWKDQNHATAPKLSV